MISFFGGLFYSLVCNGLIFMVLGDEASAALVALNDSDHTLHLYLDLRAEESHPSEIDAAYSSARIRYQICADIVGSGYFNWIFVPSSIRDLNREPNYDIFNLMYSRTVRSRVYIEYINPYRRREIVLNGVHRFNEHVFLCPVKNSLNNAIFPFAISKEYNLAPSEQPRKPGRFVFGPRTARELSAHDLLILAEEPVIVHSEPDFDIELYYLRLRRHTQPVKRNNVDPLCKLITDVDSANQHYRLCVAVLRSSHFKEKTRYPLEFSNGPDRCYADEISFKTLEGRAEGAENFYFERMIECQAMPVDNRQGDSLIYISRAYQSNAVFVYQRDPLDGNIYLENVSTNVSIVDELSSFDFVEY